MVGKKKRCVVLAQHSGSSVCDAAIDRSVGRSGRAAGRHLTNTKAPPRQTLPAPPFIFYRNKDEHKGQARHNYRECERRVDLERGTLAGPASLNTCSLMNVEPLQPSPPAWRGAELINAGPLPSGRRLPVQTVAEAQKKEKEGGLNIFFFYQASNEH